MLKYKKGDLIEAALSGKVEVIAHCCNCFNTMGSGIAPQIAKAFPEAKKVDSNTVQGDRGKLGNFTVAMGGEQCDTLIFNLYGQYGYGGRTKGEIDLNYVHLMTALIGMKMELFYDHGKHLKIGFPKIGCGLAGGDWSVVSQMIETIFEGFDVTIYEL